MLLARDALGIQKTPNYITLRSMGCCEADPASQHVESKVRYLPALLIETCLCIAKSGKIIPLFLKK